MFPDLIGFDPSIVVTKNHKKETFLELDMLTFDPPPKVAFQGALVTSRDGVSCFTHRTL